MNNRQRKRAINIIRCHKNVAMLRFVVEEKQKIQEINSELLDTEWPCFINYTNGYLSVIDGITKNEAVKIELEFLRTSFQNHKILINEYKRMLDVLHMQVNLQKSNKQAGGNSVY